MEQKDGSCEAIAEQIVESGDKVAMKSLADDLIVSSTAKINHAAEILDLVLAKKIELGASIADALVKALLGKNRKASSMALVRLPELARSAPAKVAKHLALLQSAFETSPSTVQEGIVQIYITLCTASITYQRKLEKTFHKLMENANDKQLLCWAESLLPALKGEPHASTRSIVEARIPELSKSNAKKLADILGIKLRPSLFV
ncbi:MAG: hypothetical protein IPJ88_18755 [Myxococcales bacterium]|nr:MAG: hypothetical protein IPJ88_18755 [Myxococcales bacterium]